MHRIYWPIVSDRSAGRRRLTFGLLAALAATGCGGEKKITFSSVSEPPTVQLVEPKVRTIVRVVGQPSFIQAYEHTAIYAKLPSYIEKWIVDIGDKVKKNDVLATLFMPELVEQHRTKKADVALAKDLIDQSLKLLDVANANVEAAAESLAEARAILAKYQSEADRWDTEVKRLAREVQNNVVAPQILLESQNQLKSSLAARDAAKSSIATAQANLLSKQADAAKATVDVAVARDRLVVADSEEKRLAALVGYLTLTAPFDGVIVARNANTGDFLWPTTGDPTAREMSPYKSPEGAAPVYTVDRTDVVRIFVDIPEQDANYVQIGTKASVLARAYRDKEVPASVTRTSWALNVKSRTLRAEIDIHNQDSQILPGMYAYGKVIIERPGVRAVPLDALVYSGDQTFCWLHDKGHAVRTELETGVSDGTWIEVTNRRTPASESASSAEVAWTPIDGSEQVILGDLSILSDGGPVKVDSTTAQGKVAEANADQAPGKLSSGDLARSR
jgi:multidrug efflux pump subunit AcrA (membrane-fusion protein)